MKNDQLAQGLDLPKRAVALVLAGGRGSRLKQLTDRRAKPAVSFGGKFRIIDFTLSNCINSGIRRIGVLTQYKSHSLIRHLQRGWGFLRRRVRRVRRAAAGAAAHRRRAWYHGTADAVYQNLDILRRHRPDYVLVLAGDHIYKMDYGRCSQTTSQRRGDHGRLRRGAARRRRGAFGVMRSTTNAAIVDFVEKPADPPADARQAGPCAGQHGHLRVRRRLPVPSCSSATPADPASSHDFGKDIIPPAVARRPRASAHPFRQLRRPRPAQALLARRRHDRRVLGANIELTAVVPELNLYDRDWPIWTYQAQLPPAKFVFDDGRPARHGRSTRWCRAAASSPARRCALGAVLQRARAFATPMSQVGDPARRADASGARLTKVVADRGCLIPKDMVIGENPDEDAQRFHRTEGGVTLVTRDMLAALGRGAARHGRGAAPRPPPPCRARRCACCTSPRRRSW